MALKEWMTPQEQRFFEILGAEAANVLAGAKALRDLINDLSRIAEGRKRIKEIEHRGDEIVHGLYDVLNQSFVTPIAKEDLAALGSRLDDVLDYVHAAASRIAIYEVDRSTKPMVEFSDIILRAVEQLQTGLTAVSERKKDAVLACTIEVNRLENLADDILTASLGELLKTGDPVRIIKLKEIYETLEIVTDRCEDVANILEDIVVKGR